MKMTRIAVCAVIFLAQCSHLQAQTYTGNDLLAALNDPAHRFSASRYVNGVADGLDYAYMLGGLMANPDLPKKKLDYFCYPDGVTHGQVTDIVRQHLVDSPAERHRSATYLIGSALVKAFPCR